jgi:hypothetical protein
MEVSRFKQARWFLATTDEGTSLHRCKIDKSSRHVLTLSHKKENDLMRGSMQTLWKNHQS